MPLPVTPTSVRLGLDLFSSLLFLALLNYTQVSVYWVSDAVLPTHSLWTPLLMQLTQKNEQKLKHLFKY